MSPVFQSSPGDQGERTAYTQFVFHGQCLILGDSRVGKTSLVKSLSGKPFDPAQEKTQGVDQRLVDEKWKNVDTIKDLKFGNFSQFFTEVLVQLTFFTKAGRRTVEESAKLENDPLHLFLLATVFLLLHFWPSDQPSLNLSQNINCFVLVILMEIGKSSMFYFNLGHLSRSVCVFVATAATEKYGAQLIGAFLAAMTKGYFNTNFKGLQLWSCPILPVCLAGTTAAVLLFITIYLFREIHYTVVERYCPNPGQFTLKFQTSKQPLEIILFVRFMIAVFIGYILYLVLVLIHEVENICKFLEDFAFVSHYLLAVQSLPRIVKSLSGTWSRKAKFILMFIIFSRVLKLLPGSVYFVIIYITLYSDFFYIKLPIEAGDTSEEPNPTSPAAVLVEKAFFDRKKLKSALDRKFSSFKLTILGFAGDEEYYSYHHMFLKLQALYIIVFNIAETIDNDFRDITTRLKRLQFWFESVRSKVPPGTPILLVGTHRRSTDEVSLKILDDHLRRLFWSTYCDELVLNDDDELIYFPVENSLGDTDAGIKHLQKKIMSVANQCKETLGRDIPLSWIRIRDAIISLKENKEAKSCVTLEEFPRTIDNFVSSASSCTQETLKYFHEKGLIIYLDKKQDLDLSSWILLKPEILVDIIIQLVTQPMHETQQRGLRRHWNLLQSKGILTKSLLQSIIAKVKENDEAITAFLEEYDLICPLVNKKVSVCFQDSCEPQPSHFVPSLLPMSADGSVPVWHDHNTDKTFYVFFNRFLPDPLFHRLLSRAHKNSKLEFQNGQTVIYKDAGKFFMNALTPYMLKLMKEQKMIEVTFTCSDNNGMKPSDMLCQVFSMVDGICTRYFPFVSFHCGPSCPSLTCPGHQDDYLMLSSPDEVDQDIRRCHVYNVLPGCQGDRNIAFLYCENHSFHKELDEWIP